MGNVTAAVMAMDKMLEQLSDCLNAEAARRIVGLRIGPEIQARVEVLTNKANEGLVSEEERDDDKHDIEMADPIAILKSKAQRLIPSNSRPSYTLRPTPRKWPVRMAAQYNALLAHH
jgi:hypothetical protein